MTCCFANSWWAIGVLRPSNRIAVTDAGAATSVSRRLVKVLAGSSL